MGNILNPIILTYYKSGGIMGIIFRLELYQNGTYKLYSHNILKKHHKINTTQFPQIIKLIDSINTLQDRYCDQYGYDLLIRILEINNKRIDLGSFDKNCIPANLYDSVKILENIIGF